MGVLLLASFFLVKNIKKPEYYIAGSIEASSQIAKDLSSYSYLFFSLYDDPKVKMPYGASKQFIHHDFSKGAFYFILDKNNFFIMKQKQKFPKKFRLKLRFSKRDKITESEDDLTLEKDHLHLGDSQLRFKL